MTLAFDRSSRHAPLPTIGAEIQELTRVAYRTGVEAGHGDGIAHLEAMAWDLVGDLRIYRTQRDRSHPEMTDRHVYHRLAATTRLTLVRILAIRRALKGAHR